MSFQSAAFFPSALFCPSLPASLSLEPIGENGNPTPSHPPCLAGRPPLGGCRRGPLRVCAWRIFVSVVAVSWLVDSLTGIHACPIELRACGRPHGCPRAVGSGSPIELRACGRPHGCPRAVGPGSCCSCCCFRSCFVSVVVFVFAIVVAVVFVFVIAPVVLFFVVVCCVVCLLACLHARVHAYLLVDILLACFLACLSA